ncbi:MAG TPA: flavodoxin domain-containing protein [Rectinemataceae bacterium]
MKYYVGYVSKTGTTREIAERIGAVLRQNGREADVGPIGQAGDLSVYDRLVLGSPVNGMRALPEFKAFLSGKAAPSGKRVDIFIVSYLHQTGRPMWKKAVEKDAQACTALAGPAAGNVAIFGGRLPQALPGFARFIFGTDASLSLDIRDWEAIESWAKRIAEA